MTILDTFIYSCMMYNHACISIYSTYEVRDRDCDSEVSRFKSIPGAVHIYFYQHSLSSGNYRAKTSFPFLPPTASVYLPPLHSHRRHGSFVPLYFRRQAL